MTFGDKEAEAVLGGVGVKEARALVDQALEAGVNLIDTADAYQKGRSEEIVGEVLQGRRDDIVLATKVRFALGSGPNNAGLSRRYLIKACEDSLRRLRTDYIDLYQVHERDGITPVEEILDTLDTLVHDGKVRYAGCSNHSAWHLMKALGTSERLGLTRYVSQQIYYSLLHRDAEYELVPLSIDEQVGILVWGPLAGGLLSGKFRRDRTPPPGTRHATDWVEPPIYDQNAMYDVIETLVAVSEAAGLSPAQTALAYLMGRPGVTSVLVGARSSQQLADNLASTTVKLDPEARAQLDRATALPLLYPYWHQALSAKDRLSAGDLTLLGDR
jgi:aryl-alcohol dehydrogenase-like predicted oxidoreductase